MRGQRVENRLRPAVRRRVSNAYDRWLRGSWLRWKTERSRREALERERWDLEALADWQRRRLQQCLERAATHVLYYRRHWETVGAFDTRPWTSLENWPLLPKVAVHRDPEAFVADGQHRRLLYRLYTSGTSGMPITVWRSRSAATRRRALRTARLMNWNGVDTSDPWAALGGRLIAPVGQTEPPFWEWSASQRLLSMSSYHLAPAHAAAYVAAMRDHRVVHVRGYTSSLYSLARLALENDLIDQVPNLRVAVTTAEPLYDYQRETIERAFGCRVVEYYGNIETVSAASECDHGRLHLWPEVGFVEVLKDTSDEPAAPGEVGRLVCTGLLNDAMPLVRYEIGDRGALSTEVCPCGRSLPVLQNLEGRMDDVVVLADGRRIGSADIVFQDTIPVREAQIVQERLDLVRVLVVPELGFSEKTKQLIRTGINKRIGEAVEVRVETVEEISRGPSGKFQGTVNRILQAPDTST